MRLGRAFYSDDAVEVAKSLLGKFLCVEAGKFRITETEAYRGFHDSASHAFRGITPRNEVMFGDGGFCYVYLCYGIHFLLNFVTGKKGEPEAVLIRGVEGFNGPGRLTKALGIDMSFNREDLTVSGKIWLEDGEETPEYEELERIGIDYALKEDREKLWRFYLKKQGAKK